MSTAITNIPQVGEEYSREKVELIKRTICAGSTDDELALFIYTARRTGLDPLARQIHAVKRWNAKEGREVMAIQTGIDGYRLIADRTGKLAFIGDPVYDSETAEHPYKATVTVGKMMEGVVQEVTATARWGEYVQSKKDGEPNSMWAKMPYLMLGKCAEALALRKAFPADLSGVYTEEEMMQASNGQENQPGPATQQQTAKTEPQAGRRSEKVVEGEVVKPEPQERTQAQQEGAQTREQQWSTKFGHDPKLHINFKQGNLLFIIQGKAGLSDDAAKIIVKNVCAAEHRNLIPKNSFGAVLDAIDPDFAHHEKK